MTNSIFLPGAIATLSFLCAAGHSWLGEARVFNALYAQPHEGILQSRAMRDVIRAVWHLPSIAWVAVGIALLVNGRTPNAPLFGLAIAIYLTAGLGNLIALRAPHPGGLLMLAAAALTIFLYFQSIR